MAEVVVRKGGGKAKGSANERAEARALSRWFYGDPNVLIRSEGSGSLATNRQDGLGLGDVAYGKLPKIEFPFCVELKHLKTPVELKEIFNPKSDFRKAWTQCVAAAELVKKRPLMVYRANFRKPVVSLRAVDSAALVPGAPCVFWVDEQGYPVRTLEYAVFFTPTVAALARKEWGERRVAA